RRERAADLRFEFSFPEIAEICLSQGLFPWLMSGEWIDDGESRMFALSQRGKSALGKQLAVKNDGRSFRIDDGRIVRLSHRGRDRHRRYRVEIEPRAT